MGNQESNTGPALSGHPFCDFTTVTNTFLSEMDFAAKIYAQLKTALPTDVLLLLGALVVVKFALDVLHFIFAYFVRSGKNLKKTYGEWAIVTGASDGIGKAMASQLAKKGLNIILISRTKSKLDEVKKEIEEKYKNISVKVIVIDFGAMTSKSRNELYNEIKDLNIGVLINNVGQSYSYPQYFDVLGDLSNEVDSKNVNNKNLQETIPVSDISAIMSLNVWSTTHMTAVVLPLMVKKGRGAIVNLGSMAGEVPTPLLSEYSAAKSYVSSFSKALNAEYKGKGVHIQCQVPLFVATNMSKIRKTSLFVPGPETYAKAAVNAIGYDTVISPYWLHALQLNILKALPTFIRDPLLLDVNIKTKIAAERKASRAAAEGGANSQKDKKGK